MLKSSELSSLASAGDGGGGADLPVAGIRAFAGTDAPLPFTGLLFSPVVFSSGFCGRVPLFFPKKEKTTNGPVHLESMAKHYRPGFIILARS